MLGRSPDACPDPGSAAWRSGSLAFLWQRPGADWCHPRHRHQQNAAAAAAAVGEPRADHFEADSCVSAAQSPEPSASAT